MDPVEIKPIPVTVHAGDETSPIRQCECRAETVRDGCGHPVPFIRFAWMREDGTCGFAGLPRDVLRRASEDLARLIFRD